MSFPTATIVTPTMHGPPTLGVGCPTVIIGGKPAWRVTDMHTCPLPNPLPGPPHGPGITSPPGCLTVTAGGPMLTSMTDQIIEVAALVPPTPNIILVGVPTVLSP